MERSCAVVPLGAFGIKRPAQAVFDLLRRGRFAWEDRLGSGKDQRSMMKDRPVEPGVNQMRESKVIMEEHAAADEDNGDGGAQQVLSSFP